MAQQITDRVELYDLLQGGKLVAVIGRLPGDEVYLPYEELGQSCPDLEFAEVNLGEDESIGQGYDIEPGLVTFLKNGEMVADPVPGVPGVIEQMYHTLMG